jgi:hypothetical protein
MLKIIFVFAALMFAACSHEQCNNVPQRPPASEDAGTVATATPAPTAAPVIPKDSVQIFKPTGEKQCEKGKAGIPLDEMQATLTLKKITVFESHTQSDGKMHMQLCGSPAGTIHVFTISKNDLKAAEKLGFKIFVSKK